MDLIGAPGNSVREEGGDHFAHQPAQSGTDDEQRHEHSARNWHCVAEGGQKELKDNLAIVDL